MQRRSVPRAARVRPIIDQSKGKRTMASLQIYDPFADTAVETLFRHFFRPDRTDRAAPQSIRVDVAENDKGYVVYAEIPGVKKDEIHVAIEGNQVTIAAEVKPLVAAAEGTRVLRSRALQRQRLPQLHAARRARRNGERSEVRQRRARVAARQEARRRRPQADGPVTERHATLRRRHRRCNGELSAQTVSFRASSPRDA